jgi:hypothetical protein
MGGFHSPDSVIVVVQCVVVFELILEAFNIVQDEEGARQVENARENAKKRQQSAADSHVKHKAAV